MTEGFLTAADGSRLHYVRIGADPRVVVIPNGANLLPHFAALAAQRTLVAYDLRNRGRSDPVDDPRRLADGIQNDVADLEAVRRQLGLDRLDVIGHSYPGLAVMLRSLRHPDSAGRTVLIGITAPDPAAQYPVSLSGADDVLTEVAGRIAAWRAAAPPVDPEERCRQFWALLGAIYVANPANAAEIDWGRCELANERNFLRYWSEHVLPSIQRVTLGDDDFAALRAPVLLIHGRCDRSSPYGGARDWALRLPNARLVTVDEAAHAPWIEAPAQVFESIRAFLEGDWPAAAERVTRLDPAARAAQP